MGKQRRGLEKMCHDISENIETEGKTTTNI